MSEVISQLFLLLLMLALKALQILLRLTRLLIVIASSILIVPCTIWRHIKGSKGT